MPMEGKTKSEIENCFIYAQSKAIKDIKASEIYNEFEMKCGGWAPVVFACGETEKCDNAVEAIAKSLLIMSTCDIAYFGWNWESARGCNIEHQICEKYGMPIIEYKDEVVEEAT